MTDKTPYEVITDMWLEGSRYRDFVQKIANIDIDDAWFQVLREEARQVLEGDRWPAVTLDANTTITKAMRNDAGQLVTYPIDPPYVVPETGYYRIVIHDDGSAELQPVSGEKGR